MDENYRKLRIWSVIFLTNGQKKVQPGIFASRTFLSMRLYDDLVR